MLENKKNRCKTIKENNRLQTYLTKDKVSVNINELNSLEDGRDELSTLEFKQNYTDKISALENLLERLPAEDAAGFDQKLYEQCLAEIEKQDIFSGNIDMNKRIGNKYAIREDLQTAISVSDDINDVLKYLEDIGHSVSLSGKHIIIDGISSDAFSWHKDRTGEIIDNYSIDAIINKIEHRKDYEVPDDEKYQLNEYWEQAKQLKLKDQLGEGHYDWRTGHLYLIDLRYGLFGRRRSWLERLFIKIFLRDRKHEREAMEIADENNAAKQQKFDYLNDKEHERIVNAASLAVRYDIYSPYIAKQTKDVLAAQIVDMQTRAGNVSKDIYIMKRQLQYPGDFAKRGFSSKEEYTKYLEQQIRIKTNTVNLIKSDIRDIQSDIRNIDRDLMPYLNSISKTANQRLTAEIREYKKSARELDRDEKKIPFNLEVIKNQKELYDGIVGTRAQLESKLKELRHEAEGFVNVQKCVNEYNTFRNTDSIESFTDDLIDNLRNNNKNVPELNKAAKSKNGQDARLSQHIIISPDPLDKVEPSKMHAFMKDFMQSEYMSNYIAYGVVHVDKFTGIDKATGKEYNMHLKGHMDENKNRVHGHIHMGVCGLDGKMYHDTGDLLKEQQKLELNLNIKYGMVHTAQHNSAFTELIHKKSPSREDVIKLSLATGVLTYNHTAGMICDTSTGEVTHVDSKDIDAVCKEYSSLVDIDIDDLRNRVKIENEKENKLHKSAAAPSRPEIERPDSNVMVFWLTHMTDKEALKKRIENDIEIALSHSPQVLGESKETIAKGITSLQGELREMGYKVRIQKGQFKISIDKNMFPEEIKPFEISTSSLNQSLYSWEILAKECTNNRHHKDIDFESLTEKVNKINNEIQRKLEHRFDKPVSTPTINQNPNIINNIDFSEILKEIAKKREIARRNFQPQQVAKYDRLASAIQSGAYISLDLAKTALNEITGGRSLTDMAVGDDIEH